MAPRRQPPKVCIGIREKVFKIRMFSVPNSKTEGNSSVLSFGRRGRFKNGEGVPAGRASPGKSIRLAWAPPMGNKKRIRNLGNSMTNRRPKGQKVITSITRRGKRKFTEQFNPMVADQRVNIPTSHRWNREFRNGRRKR